MHIDLNSCFASVEQQANPLLRGKPVAVVTSPHSYSCILAPSVEAKLWGVRTGMTVQEGMSRCPWLILRESDPPKYREVHHSIGKLLSEYSPCIISKSIDEYCLDLRASPTGSHPVGLVEVAKEIKARIRSEIGSYLRTSVGLSTNQNLAKLASGLHKPDGLDIIDHTNYQDIYGRIKLQNFCGINSRNEARLNRVGIYTALQFYQAPVQSLQVAFQSILGQYWYTRLRGYEVDDVAFTRRSFGQSYVLPRPMPYQEWRPILSKLAAKAARRLRRSGYLATGVYLSLFYGDHTVWHISQQGAVGLHDDPSLLASALALYHQSAPKREVKKLAVSFFGLEEDNGQQSLLIEESKRRNLIRVVDQLNDKWGEYTLIYGSHLGSSGYVRDAISFGQVQ